MTEHDAADELTPEDVRGSFPTPDSVSPPEAHRSPFNQLFAPRAKAAILDILVEERGTPLTAKEIVDRSDDVSRSSFGNYCDELLEYGVMVEDGKVGNAMTYRLNIDHPVARCLVMLDNLIIDGETPMLIQEQFITTQETTDGE